MATTKRTTATEEYEHRIALKLAEPLRRTSRELAERSIIDWFIGASIIRDATVKAKRTMKNRMRSKKAPRGVNYGWEYVVQIAELIVLRVAHKEKLEELSPAEVGHVRGALAEAAEAARDVGEQAEIAPDAAVSSWTLVMVAGAAAYARATGKQVMGSIAAPAALGSGKHNSPMHIAALALAELGIPDPEVQRALQSVRPGELKDRAQIRRLTRAARVS